MNGMALISRETLAWVRIHIAKANANHRVIRDTLVEIDEALKGPIYQKPQPAKGSDQ